MARKFSLTSSQAHGAVVTAFPLFQDKPAWIKVVSFMYGEENWKEALNLPDPAVAPAGEDNVTNDFDSVSSNDHGDEDPLKPRSVREYLINFIPAEDQDFERLAMVFLKKYVLGDGDVDPTDEHNDSDFKRVIAIETEAKIVVEGLANQVRRAILKILPLQIKHEPYRGKMTKADLCVWLQKPNDTRNFLCYKSVGLKALMAARSLTLANGPKTSARMVEALAGVPGVAIEAAPTANEEDVEDTSPRAAAIRAILEKSFLPFQKGKARDTCNLGHRLEKPIQKNGWKLLMEKSHCLVPLLIWTALMLRGRILQGWRLKKELSMPRTV